MNDYSTKLGGGEIVAVLDNTTVVIDQGLSHGIEYNDLLNVNTDNSTGLKIRVRVTMLVEFYCVAKLETPTPPSLTAVLSAINKRLLSEQSSSPNALYGLTNEL